MRAIHLQPGERIIWQDGAGNEQPAEVIGTRIEDNVIALALHCGAHDFIAYVNPSHEFTRITTPMRPRYPFGL